MRLLFDENLSPRLPKRLADAYPNSSHVRDVGLRGASDEQIWIYAQAHQLSIVSKDSDFRERSVLQGGRPKIIWLDVANSSTSIIESLLRQQRERIARFTADPEASVLIVSLSGWTF